jgi:hypothetical protein
MFVCVSSQTWRRHKRRQFFKARAKAWVSSNEKEAFAILFFRFRFKHD